MLRGRAAQIEEGENVTLVLDFDVAQSFGRQAGQSGRWVARPVVHATRVEGPGLEGSAIRGTVALELDEGSPTFEIPECPTGTARSLTDFVPTATAHTLVDAEDAPVVRSGQVAQDGTFSINFVEPDTYTVGFSPLQLGDFRLEWSATVSPTQVTVVEGASVQGVSYTLTGASCVAS